MQEFRERLAAAMREKGIRASRLASETGLSPARISQYLHGVYQPKGDAILRLAEALGVSAMWLMGEDCPMTASAPAGASAGLPDNLLPLQLRRYPLLGDIACGKPIVAQDNGDSYVSAADTEADFCLIAKGDSMVGARIYDGDEVFIQQTDMVNNGEIAYNDIHLSQMAQEVRYGFMGKVNVAIIEACEVTPDGKIYLTAAGGIAPTICRLADQIIVELNSAHSKSGMGMHDVYEPLDPPYRREIPIYKPSDRIGLPYVQIDPKKIIGVVETNWPDEARSFAAADPLTDKIGQNVADFLAADMKRGIIPSSFLPLQSGVGNIANAVLGALGRDKTIPAFEMYTEVIQNSVIGLIREGRIKFGSACSLTVTNDCLEGIYNDMDFFRDKLVLRPSEISNSPEIVRRLGIISINTAIEVDLYGNVNSTHIGGTKMMNGIGGSGDFTRNAYISIFTCPSVAKEGKISAIVPMVSHHDHTEHDVNIVITEQGVADLRGKSPKERAQAIIENCAHPDYKELLWDYLKLAGNRAQTPHAIQAALGMHAELAKSDDMKNTNWAEYSK